MTDMNKPQAVEMLHREFGELEFYLDQIKKLPDNAKFPDSLTASASAKIEVAAEILNELFDTVKDETT